MITRAKIPDSDRQKVPPSEPNDNITTADVKLISAAARVLLRVSGAAQTLFVDETRH